MIKKEEKKKKLCVKCEMSQKKDMILLLRDMQSIITTSTRERRINEGNQHLRPTNRTIETKIEVETFLKLTRE